MGKIEGDGSIPPQLRDTYRQEFNRGLNLFQQSLAEYKKSDGFKKDEFKNIMDRALQVMNETAKLCLSVSGQKKEESLEKDYQAFISDGSNANLKKLEIDIDTLHGSR